MQEASPKRAPRLPAASARSIGILSSSFRLPGQRLHNPSSGAHAGVALLDSVSHMPPQRWDTDGPLAALVTAGGTTIGGAPPLPVCLGSFLPPGVAELFDAAAFGLSPQECVLLDPQQRLLSECAAEALSGAAPSDGFGPDDRARFGVHVGASSLDYNKLCTAYHPAASAFSATGVMERSEREVQASPSSYRITCVVVWIGLLETCTTAACMTCITCILGRHSFLQVPRCRLRLAACPLPLASAGQPSPPTLHVPPAWLPARVQRCTLGLATPGATRQGRC